MDTWTPIWTRTSRVHIAFLVQDIWTTSLVLTAKFGWAGFSWNSVFNTLSCQTGQGAMPFAGSQPPASQSRVQRRDLELRNNSLITSTLVTHRSSLNSGSRLQSTEIGLGQPRLFYVYLSSTGWSANTWLKWANHILFPQNWHWQMVS